MVKIEMFANNRNIGQKPKFGSKIEILVKNRNFSQKWKFLSKIGIFVKNRNFDHKSNTIIIIMTWLKILKNRQKTV